MLKAIDLFVNSLTVAIIPQKPSTNNHQRLEIELTLHEQISSRRENRYSMYFAAKNDHKGERSIFEHSFEIEYSLQGKIHTSIPVFDGTDSIPPGLSFQKATIHGHNLNFPYILPPPAKEGWGGVGV